MADDADVVRVVTRGFENLDKQIRDRDEKVSSLSEKMVGVELKLDQLKETLANKNETDKIAMRVNALEETNKEIKQKQIDNSKLIKGLIVSVVILLLGFVLNFIRIGIK